MSKIVGGAYPAIDIFLVFCLLAVAARSKNAALGPILPLLIGGIILVICGDSIYNYLFLHHITFVDQVNGYILVDLINVLGDMLIGLAAYALRWLNFQQASTTPTKNCC